MKLLTAALAAAFIAASSSVAFAGGDGGCPFSSKLQTTAETLLPAPDATSTGS